MATDLSCVQCGEPYDSGVVANRFAGVCPACLLKFAASGEVERAPEIEPPLKVGGTFHGLEVMQLLGAGGMGVVYKARQPGLDRFVALKVLSPKLTGDSEFIARFNREARAMAALNHAGIVQVFDYGQEAGLCYLVMEFVDGVSLRDLMKGGLLAPEKALKIVPQICEALDYAHSKGVIHRDIKPENILAGRDGRVKIADFGLARVLAPDGGGSHLTISNVVMGTPGYMAPEQYRSMKVDHRADIYSLGAVFYEMLTGRIPVGLFQPPSSNVRIDVRLDEIVLKALATEPDLRYQRAGDVKTDVEACESFFMPAAPKASEWPRNDPWMPWLLRALLPALCLLAGVLLAEGRLMIAFGAKGNGDGPPIVVVGLIILAGAIFGIARWNAHWGRPMARWRWLAAAGTLTCGLAAFLAYAYLEIEWSDRPTYGPAAGLGILAAGLFLLTLLEFRMMKSPAAGPLGDEHLPHAIQAPFRASTLAAASLAFAGLSYGLFLVVAAAEEGLQFGRRSWQDADAAIWIMLVIQVVAAWLASKAILLREPRSGRIQAYAALFLSLPPLGMLMAMWHLHFTEPGMPGPKSAAPLAKAPMSRLILAAMILVAVGTCLSILAFFVWSSDRASRSPVPTLGIVLLLLGLALSLGGFREIGRSQGKLRGSGLGLVVFLGSLVMVLAIFIVSIQAQPRPRSVRWPLGKYDSLTKISYPRGWGNTRHSVQLIGPAGPQIRPMDKEETEELGFLKAGPRNGYDAKKEVVRMTVYRLMHQASRAHVKVRVAEMSRAYAQRNMMGTYTRLGLRIESRARFIVEIEAADPEAGEDAVEELSVHYKKYWNEIEQEVVDE